MKKIVFVTGVLSNGGAERVISILAQTLNSIGYKVFVITIYGSKNDYLNDCQNVEIVPLPETKGILRPLKISISLRKRLKEICPDVVISFVAIINIYTIISSFLLKRNFKLIVSERNDPYQNPTNKIIRMVRDNLYNFVDGFVFQTNDAKKYFSKKIQKKSVIIPNPIKSGLPQWESEKKEKIIITASRLSPQKNLPMLIKAFAKINNDFPEYKLKIFGTGELKNELKDFITNLSLNNTVSLEGFSNEIHEEMSKSSLFVLSSNYEGISNSMLEALAIGVPVISTDAPIGGAKMYIQSGYNGILVPVKAENDLYNAMRKIIIDDELAIMLSNNAKAIKENLTQEKISKLWLSYIKEVTGGKNGRLYK